MKKQEDFKRFMEERRAGGGGGGGPHTTKSRRDSSQTTDYATVGEKLMPLRTQEDVLSLCRTVEMSRASASHELNERSSRSHCLVTIHIVSNVNGKTTHNKCLLVDLAGSERIAKTKVEGVAKAQAIEINKSLTALGRVVKSLGARVAHVPYRDSTLTMLLRDSFGGKASTTVVVCVADVEAHNEETARSLQFGKRLTNVTNNLTKNVNVSDSEVRQGRAAIESSLAQKKAELGTLDAGGVDAAATNPAAIRKFNNDVSRLEKLKNRIKVLRESDYKSGRKSSEKNNAELAGLQDQARRLHEDVERTKTAVDRTTLRTFWREPSPAWVRVDNEIRELEGKLAM
jgi:hypothetical protein